METFLSRLGKILNLHPGFSCDVIAAMLVFF